MTKICSNTPFFYTFIIMEKIFYSNINAAENPYYIHHIKKTKFETDFRSFEKGILFYAEGGVLHIFGEEQHWYLPGRCYMWIPAGTKHRIVSHSLLINLHILFFETETNEDVFFKDVNIYLVNDLLREMLLFTQTWNGGINETQKAKFDFIKAIKSILPMIGNALNNFPIQHPYPNDDRLIAIAQFLNQHIQTAYTLEEIAKKFGFSTRTLSRLFKENLGMSYVRFLRAIRISKALELMSEKKLNVYEIAVSVGYTSLSAFSNIFLKIMGMRPADYMARL